MLTCAGQPKIRWAQPSILTTSTRASCKTPSKRLWEPSWGKKPTFTYRSAPRMPSKCAGQQSHSTSIVDFYNTSRSCGCGGAIRPNEIESRGEPGKHRSGTLLAVTNKSIGKQGSLQEGLARTCCGLDYPLVLLHRKAISRMASKIIQQPRQ